MYTEITQREKNLPGSCTIKQEGVCPLSNAIGKQEAESVRVNSVIGTPAPPFSRYVNLENTLNLSKP